MKNTTKKNLKIKTEKIDTTISSNKCAISNNQVSNDFIDNIVKKLSKFKIIVNQSSIKMQKHKCLPDNLDKFNNLFIDPNTHSIKNKLMFQKRIMGLTSYFKSANEKLLPKFDKKTDIERIELNMSNYQLNVYEQTRVIERSQELRNAKNRKKGKITNMYEESNSTYRVYSRACCNFVFPNNIPRPMVKETTMEFEESKKILETIKENTSEGETKKSVTKSITKNSMPLISEDMLDETTSTDLIDSEADELQRKNEIEKIVDNNYSDRINMTLERLSEATVKNADGFDEKLLFGDNFKHLSPKFHHILQTLKNTDFYGTHLLYSSFKRLEGIGVLKLILEANGFVQFKLKNKIGQAGKNSREYEINIEELRNKPSFALYTGDEKEEEKNILRLIFNSEWDKISDKNLVEQLKNLNDNNYYGEVIKCFMITSSGAEGITLKNTRYVHILEPYWHPVREEQVIGRAVRICSHENLPEKDRNVKVLKYIMTLSEEQKYGNKNETDPVKRKPIISTELRLKDTSKYFKTKKGKKIVTTDEALDEISGMKSKINQNILNAIKYSAIDCKIHNKPGTKEYKQCFTFNSPSANKYLYKPSFSTDETDAENFYNVENITWKPEKIILQNKNFILKRDNPNKIFGQLYDFDEYEESGRDPMALRLIGKLLPSSIEKGNYTIEYF